MIREKEVPFDFMVEGWQLQCNESYRVTGNLQSGEQLDRIRVRSWLAFTGISIPLCMCVSFV